MNWVPTAGFGPLEYELKHEVAPRLSVALVRDFLDSCCVADLQHPLNTVATIYYDTPSLALLGEKFDSDYLKTRVRLRWYEEESGPPPTAAFAEVKLRRGTRRSKGRVRLKMPEPAPGSLELDHPGMPDLGTLLRRAGLWCPPLLMPVLFMRYERLRWVEPYTGTRVSLDREIRVEAHNPLALPGSVMTKGGLGTVVEAKGDSPELPPAMRGLLELGCRADSFSKYALACFST